jgi:hypothetical protein
MAMAAGDPGDGTAGIKAAAAATAEGGVDTTEQTEGESGTAMGTTGEAWDGGTSIGGTSIGSTIIGSTSIGGGIMMRIMDTCTVSRGDAMTGTVTDHRMGTGAIWMQIGTPGVAESHVATARAVRTGISELERNPR